MTIYLNKKADISACTVKTMIKEVNYKEITNEYNRKSTTIVFHCTAFKETDNGCDMISVEANIFVNYKNIRFKNLLQSIAREFEIDIDNGIDFETFAGRVVMATFGVYTNRNGDESNTIEYLSPYREEVNDNE